jgi:hypothetical protein
MSTWHLRYRCMFLFREVPKILDSREYWMTCSTGDTQEEWERETPCWRKRGERRWGRSQIIWRRESPVLYKSFNTLWWEGSPSFVRRENTGTEIIRILIRRKNTSTMYVVGCTFHLNSVFIRHFYFVNMNFLIFFFVNFFWLLPILFAFFFFTFYVFDTVLHLRRFEERLQWSWTSTALESSCWNC